MRVTAYISDEDLDSGGSVSLQFSRDGYLADIPVDLSTSAMRNKLKQLGFQKIDQKRKDIPAPPYMDQEEWDTLPDIEVWISTT